MEPVITGIWCVCVSGCVCVRMCANVCMQDLRVLNALIWMSVCRISAMDVHLGNDCVVDVYVQDVCRRCLFCQILSLCVMPKCKIFPNVSPLDVFAQHVFVLVVRVQ